jgi:choline dehydrogenase-like flavoprotein
MARQQTDVCIVGSGAAGGAVAEEFTRAGLTVTMLERGPAFNIRDMRQMDEIRFGQRSGLSGNAMQPSVLRPTSDVSGATVRGQASGTGGGTLHWPPCPGACTRTTSGCSASMARDLATCWPTGR